MLLPDLEDALLIAARVLEVDREDVTFLVRKDRLHYALLAPTMRIRRANVFRSPGSIAASLFTECALSDIVPRRSERFGWLMAQRAIELSDYVWTTRPGDTEQLAGFGQQLSERIRPGRALARWLDARITSPQAADPPRSTRTRDLHVSSPMTGLKPKRLAIMRDWATAVDDGLNDFLAERRTPDEATTKRPQIYSASGDNEEALIDQIECRLRQADGLVVLAWKGSWGAGIELEIALRGMVPTLYLHPEREQLGYRTRGRLQAAGATILPFDDTALDEQLTRSLIRELVYRWLQDEYPAILGTARRRAIVDTRLAEFLQALRTAQTQMTPLEWRERLAVVGLTERRVLALTSQEHGLQDASVPELFALSAAHTVPANFDGLVPETPADRPPYLKSNELASLQDVVRVDHISGHEAVDMMMAASCEVALPGRRRKGFDDDASWRQLRRRLPDAK